MTLTTMPFTTTSDKAGIHANAIKNNVFYSGAINVVRTTNQHAIRSNAMNNVP